MTVTSFYKLLSCLTLSDRHELNHWKHKLNENRCFISVLSGCWVGKLYHTQTEYADVKVSVQCTYCEGLAFEARLCGYTWEG